MENNSTCFELEQCQKTTRAVVAILVLTILFAILPADFDYTTSLAKHDLSEGTLIGKIKWIFVFAVAAWLLWNKGVTNWQQFIFTNPFFWLLFIYSFFTIFWSPLPLVTLKRGFQFSGVILISLALASGLAKGSIDFIRIGFWTLFSILLACVWVVIFDPTNGIEQSNAFELKNAWKGILNQKNTLGGAAAIATYFWMVFHFNDRIKPSISIATLIICLMCLVMARSSTSITLAGASIAIFLILRKNYIQSDLWLLRLFFFIALVIGIYLHIFYLANSRIPNWGEVIAPIAEMFGKGVDLSGRSVIWKHMWIEIDLHWLNGYGYGAFWVDPPERFKANFPYVFYQAHNGYIDVINDLGLIGLFLFLGFLFFHAFNLYRLFLIDQHSAAFHAGLLAMYLLSNITESSAMQALSIFHIFIIMSFFLVAQQVGQQRTFHDQQPNWAVN